MKRKLGAVLFVIYSIIAIAVTVLILSYNEYKISEIGEYTIYILKDDSLEPKYKQGSILIVKNTNDRHVKVGDELLLYKVYNSTEFEVVHGTLQEKNQQGRHISYNVKVDGIEDPASNGIESYDTDYFIGKSDDTIVIEGPWGTILSILESKWGYLFCIVIVSLLLFLQEVFDLVIEIKYGGTKGTKAANIAHERKTAKKAGTSTRKASTGSKTSTATSKGSSAKTTTKTSKPKTVEPKVSVEANDAETKVEEEIK